jgi:integrase
VAKRYAFLHQRGDVYYFLWRDKAGKRFEESLRTTDLQIARERYRKRMNEIEAGCSPNDLSGSTLQQASDNWLEHRQFQVSKGSYHAEHSSIRSLIRVFGADSRLRSLADISQLRQYQHQRRKTGISAKTVNNELLVLRGMLQRARLWQRVEREYRPLRVKKSDIPDALTQEEAIRLLKTAAKSPATAVAPFAAVLALGTGLRSGEIKRLKHGDLHHRENFPFIAVRRATTKTDAGSRRVALDSIGVWAAERLLNRACLVGSLQPGDYLLPTDLARHTKQSDPLHGNCGFDPRHFQSSWQGEWDKFRHIAGIHHRRFHDLRHTYISRAAEAGVPISVLQAQVGHVNAQMVAWYTHISARAQYRAACRMEAASPELMEAMGFDAKDSVFPENGGAGASGNARQASTGSDAGGLGNPVPQTARRVRGRCRAWSREVSFTNTGSRVPRWNVDRVHS